jgi:hypothetical protein
LTSALDGGEWSLYINSCTRDIAHNKERATIRNLKPEWRGALLVQEEKYQEKGNV